MVPPPRAQASYKKQSGILAISRDRKSLSWSPTNPPDADPAIVISAASVTNLQQTPESSAKVMLKIAVQEPGQSEAIAHTFQFTNGADARAEANAIKDVLASAIQAQKQAQTALTVSGGQSAAMTMANVISGGGRATSLWEDDERLKGDVELQQSLMQEDPVLKKTFMEALRMKPDSVSNTQFTSQFWSSRVHQLRAHAVARIQGRGRYAVFANIQVRQGMSLTSEQISAILQQYPVVRLVYDEVVPAKIKNDGDFWSRFFQSQLYNTLKGMKVDRTRDARDPLLDSYLDHPGVTGQRLTASEMHIPKFIDLEGNEENHSQRKGNAPEGENKSSALDKAPIIRRLNALSEKIMANARPSDADASAPIGMQEAEYEQLRLRDLVNAEAEDQVRLNIRDQSRFFADDRAASASKEDDIPHVEPSKALRRVCSDLATTFPRPGVQTLPIDPYESAGEDDGDDDDDDDDSPPSGSSIATAHIMSLIRQNRDQTAEVPERSGLSQATYDNVQLTHATSLEFLSQFWHAFLSGEPGRALEVNSLVESLKRALERINHLAQGAGKERDDLIKTQEATAREVERRTGRRPRLNEAAFGGGADVVRQLLAPMVRSLQTALRKFTETYEEQAQQLGGTDE